MLCLMISLYHYEFQVLIIFSFLTEMVRLFKVRHATAHMFKIDHFSLLRKHGIEKVESSVFDLAGHKW